MVYSIVFVSQKKESHTKQARVLPISKFIHFFHFTLGVQKNFEMSLTKLSGWKKNNDTLKFCSLDGIYLKRKWQTDAMTIRVLLWAIVWFEAIAL